jgi:hypothetical protein
MIIPCKVSNYIFIINKYKAADNSIERIPLEGKTITIKINMQQSNLTMIIIPWADRGSTTTQSS